MAAVIWSIFQPATPCLWLAKSVIIWSISAICLFLAVVQSLLAFVLFLPPHWFGLKIEKFLSSVDANCKYLFSIPALPIIPLSLVGSISNWADEGFFNDATLYFLVDSFFSISIATCLTCIDKSPKPFVDNSLARSYNSFGVRGSGYFFLISSRRFCLFIIGCCPPNKPAIPALPI